MKKKIISIIGARPQFIKHAPMQLELQQHFDALTVHTGQHYDSNMSDVFFKELRLPQPDYLFDIGGSKPQGEQTGIMMTEIEKVCATEKPDAVLVYGDTNSTLAGTLVAAKMGIKLIHIEAGLRSFNREMPEEVNRIVADEFAWLLFCPTAAAVNNLRQEGIVHERIFTSGDVMCDTLQLVQDKTKQLLDIPYYFVTLHRPYNTDIKERLALLLHTLNKLDKRVVFPIHPRTVARMKSFELPVEQYSNIEFIAPTGYIESVSWQKYADCVITDSGGMQKEAYMLRRKCITIRSETEWTETLENGWNKLIFDDLSLIPDAIAELPGTYVPDIYGKGNAAKEITAVIKEKLI